MAEREGFEPPVTVRLQRFSRPPLSTTQPSLCVQEDNILILKTSFNVLYVFRIKLLLTDRVGKIMSLLMESRKIILRNGNFRITGKI